jgi:hypothetical protein
MRVEPVRAERVTRARQTRLREADLQEVLAHRDVDRGLGALGVRAWITVLDRVVDDHRPAARQGAVEEQLGRHQPLFGEFDDRAEPGRCRQAEARQRAGRVEAVQGDPAVRAVRLGAQQAPAGHRPHASVGVHVQAVVAAEPGQAVVPAGVEHGERGGEVVVVRPGPGEIGMVPVRRQPATAWPGRAEQSGQRAGRQP